MLIRNNEDLRDAYWTLSVLETFPLDDPAVIVNIKRDIRAYNNRPKPERRIVCGDFDGFIELRPLPDADSIEQAEEIFREYYYIESPCSWYDCTGRPFTRWHKIFQRHGRYYAYHAVNYDV